MRWGNCGGGVYMCAGVHWCVCGSVRMKVRLRIGIGSTFINKDRYCLYTTTLLSEIVDAFQRMLGFTHIHSYHIL